jgi:hypothetical protein
MTDTARLRELAGKGTPQVDPDETAGRALYRSYAEARARADVSRAKHPVKLREEDRS